MGVPGRLTWYKGRNGVLKPCNALAGSSGAGILAVPAVSVARP